MKCPVCNRDVVGKSCSYCGTEIESISVEDKKLNLKNNFIFGLLLFFNIVFMLLPILNCYVAFLSVILAIVSILFLLKKVKPYISKSKLIFNFSLVMCFCALSFIPLSEKVTEYFSIKNAYLKYSELVDVKLPNYTAKKEYISSLDKGYRIERFIYSLSNDEIEVLINSNEHFEEISCDSKENKTIFNIWYSDIDTGYYLIYNILDNNYDDIDDFTLYHYCIIVIQNDNTVFVDEITKTPTEVSS